MKNKKLYNQISQALYNVDLGITGITNNESLYSRGLASEGYLGGYADALRDILFLIGCDCKMLPNRSNFWVMPKEDRIGG